MGFISVSNLNWALGCSKEPHQREPPLPHHGADTPVGLSAQRPHSGVRALEDCAGWIYSAWCFQFGYCVSARHRCHKAKTRPAERRRNSRAPKQGNAAVVGETPTPILSPVVCPTPERRNGGGGGGLRLWPTGGGELVPCRCGLTFQRVCGSCSLKQLFSTAVDIEY